MGNLDKVRPHAFFTINIKLRKHNNKRDATAEEYASLIKKVHKKKIHKPSSPGKHCIIQYLREVKDNKGKIDYLYGRLTQFTYFENKNWFDLSTLDFDKQFQLRDGLFPDAADADFIFDPYTHKFAYIKKSNISISPYPVRTFWEEALNAAKDDNEFIHVDVVTGDDFQKLLVEARQIRRLEIDLNYSNSGIGSITKELLDESLKNANPKSASFVIVAKPNESLQIKNSEILQGALELAREDGDANAKVIDNNGNLVDISTRNYPRKDFFQSNILLIWDNFIEKARQLWPKIIN
ncbi:DUF4747 family protein [Pedobacter suwonensis]|uniref:DUF4747 family protein n=1 Tax=Pedobacter suwonensis TaxID=332999 RepID=UPI0036D14D9F